MLSLYSKASNMLVYKLAYNHICISPLFISLQNSLLCFKKQISAFLRYFSGTVYTIYLSAFLLTTAISSSNFVKRTRERDAVKIADCCLIQIKYNVLLCSYASIILNLACIARNRNLISMCALVRK